jgi:hypothetical protein
MDFNEFWKLIDSGVGNPQVVVDRLRSMPEADLVEFFWTYKEMVDVFLMDKFAEQVAEPYSEDTHKDIAEWVIAQGDDFQNDVAFNPSKFPPRMPEGGDEYSYVADAANIYHDRFGQSIRMREEPPPA